MLLVELDVDRLRQDATAALRAAGASFAYVHGSRASGSARSDSDLDVAAYWGSAAPASFEVDLPPDVDLLVLNSAPLELRGRVAEKGLLLFDTDPAVRVHWEAMTRKIWFDERPRIERAHREFAAALARRSIELDEDLADIRAAEEAREEMRRTGEEPVSWDVAKAELGLTDR